MEPSIRSMGTMTFVSIFGDFPDDSPAKRVVDPDREIWKEGISRIGYFIGILFVMSIVFIFGKYPQHTWLLLIVGLSVLPFIWYYHVARYRHGAYYIVELRWLVAFGIALYLSLVYSSVLDDRELEWGYCFMFMYSAGYLSFCAVACNSKVVFYSRERLIDLFIHAVPLVTLLAMRKGNGFTDAVTLAWPSYFPERVWSETTTSELLVCGYVPYFLWFVPYSVWLLRKGIDLPQQGYSTSFNMIYVRRFKERVTMRMNIHSARMHALVFLFGHFVCVSVSFFYAILVWNIFELHVCWVVTVLLYSLLSGADHYIRVSVAKFGPLIGQKEADEARRATAVERHRKSRSSSRRDTALELTRSY